MSFINYQIIIIIGYAIYYGVNLAMDKSGQNGKGSKGEISLAGIDGQEAAPVHSSVLLEEFRKLPGQANQPKPASKDGAFEFDTGDEGQEGMEPLSDEDVTRQ